jgi:type II secretory pathway component PulF
MNEQEILNKIAEQDKKIEEMSNYVKKIKRYIMIFIIISVASVVLPLIGMLFAIPTFLSSYSNLSELGL